MANQEHLAVLRQGIDIWNDWRKRNPAIRPDLSGIDLREVDLVLGNLSGANLSHADLSYADLSFANLSRANLSFTILSYADLSGTNLSEAILFRSILYAADLSSANLGQAKFSEADLSGADLSGANWNEAILERVQAKDTPLESLMLEQANAATMTQTSAIDGFMAEPFLFQTDTVPINGFYPPPPSETEQSVVSEALEPEADGRITVTEGITQSLFDNQLYLTVRTVNPGSVSFIMGAFGYPSQEVDAVEIGFKAIYLDRFEIHLVDASYEDATFLVYRFDESDMETLDL